MGAVTPEEASSLIARDVRRADRSIDGFLSELILFLERRLLEQLRDFPTGGGQLTQRQTLRVLGGLESLVFDSSLEERMDIVRELFDLQEQLSNGTLERLIGKQPSSLSRETKRDLGVFVSSRQAFIRAAVSQYIANVREQLVSSILSNQQLVISDVLQQAGGRIFSDLKVRLQTDISTYGRLSKLERGLRGGYVYFLYAGPRDDRNRPFCAERANNIYHINDIYTWQNGQLEPPWIYCGGYNCRHELVPSEVPDGLPNASARPAEEPPKT